MATTKNVICDFGWKARDFTLQGVDGKVLLTAGRPSTVAGRVRVAQGEWRIPFSVFLFVFSFRFLFFVYSFSFILFAFTERGHDLERGCDGEQTR
jgi:hypothetical protein